VKAADIQNGGRRWNLHEAAFRHNLEQEFIDLSGRFIPCRSAYSGFALPVIGGAVPQAMTSFFLNAILPDLALRQWLLLRRMLLDAKHPGRLNLRRFWPIDTGNYRFSRAASFAGTALAAAEMGDSEIATLCLSALEEHYPVLDQGEVFYRPGASVWTHAVEFFARSASKDGFRTLIEQPRAGTPQPSLHDVRYPDVLVARAVYQHGKLSAVLYPGASAGRQALGLAGLMPGRTYLCNGCDENTIVADACGSATIHLQLDGRRQIDIYARS
jgi:Linalool dehydratase/isomerase